MEIIISTYNLFDICTIKPLKGFSYSFDGPVGKRVLFIEDKKENIRISFEEGMECLDLKSMGRHSCEETELKACTSYIHQLRIGKLPNFAFFHIEYFAADDKTVILPGQIFADDDYNWSAQGVEPVLLDIMNSISVK